ncbi:hypothetical protein ZIOFF_009777 [Zingiber officinale]|uniref:Uncharacterized protein n=1 Tax=Zingiber officinale TaxID=94328 RepID=A0A8J5HHT3_ZINOF|nr:hypothetical protein ZIOFF_009777 [Zingiber officinale]
MATARRGTTFAGANVFLSRSLVPPDVFDALHDALKLNGATVFLCSDPSRTAANDYHVIASSNHEKFENLRAKGCNLLGTSLSNNFFVSNWLLSGDIFRYNSYVQDPEWLKFGEHVSPFGFYIYKLVSQAIGAIQKNNEDSAEHAD